MKTSSRKLKELIRALMNGETRLDALYEMSALDMDEMPEEVAGLLGDSDGDVRLESIRLLRRDHRHDRSAEVAGLLEDMEDLVRIEAIEYLVEKSAREYADHIWKNWRRSDRLVRAYTYWAMGRLGVKERAGDLDNAFTTETDDLAKAGCLEALCVLGSAGRHLGALIGILGSHDHGARCFAANSLAGVALFGGASEREKERIKEALRKALIREEAVSVRECLENNLGIITEIRD